MNPKISELARQPRGKPWRSHLIPYMPEIQQWRRDDISYRQIAVLLRERGVRISSSGVHNFVRVRDLAAARRLYKLPDEQPNVGTYAPSASVTLDSASSIKPAPKRYVFQQPPAKRVNLREEQLAINNPLDEQETYADQQS